MPLPMPQATETREMFVARCMKDPATQDISGDNADQTQQRQLAACFRQWEDGRKSEDSEMQTKALGMLEIKDAAKGEVTAVVATYDVVDKDGDVIFPGAIPDGTQVIMSAYAHSTPKFDEAPVGKGRITTLAGRAVFQGKFFLSTTRGQEAFRTTQEMGTDQEWSIGFLTRTVKTRELTDEWRAKGARRLITGLDTREVSPVFIGAGVNTHTVAIKDAPSGDPPKALALHTAGGYSAAPWDAAAEEAAMDVAAVKESALAFIGGDPEAKTNYKLLYRERGGKVNSHAAAAIEAVLGGARGGVDLPAAIRGEVEANAKRLMEFVQSQEKAAKDAQASKAAAAEFQRFERTRRRLGA